MEWMKVEVPELGGKPVCPLPPRTIYSGRHSLTPFGTVRR